jgi:hypothetical protein
MKNPLNLILGLPEVTVEECSTLRRWDLHKD